MNQETYIPMEDVLISIKYHPDITEKEKQDFKKSLNLIINNDKKKENETNKSN
jgi:hypothetical protein